MNAKLESGSPASGPSKLDTVKLIVAIAVLIAGVWFFHQYEGRWPTYARVLEMTAALVIGGLIALQTDMGRRFAGFATKSRDELRKVVWPTRQETLQSTLVIMVVVVVVGIVLWIIDSLLGALMRVLLG